MGRPRAPEAYVDVMQGTFLFSGMDETDIAALLRLPGVSVRSFPAETKIYCHEGCPACLGAILAGSATVEKRTETERMLMSMLGPKDLFGAAGMFSDEEAYVVDITARSDTRALLIPEETLKEMMRRDFRVTENYLRYLTSRIRFLNKRIDGFVLPTTEARVLLYLENNAVNGVFSPNYPLTALADALCIGRATLYRALDALAERGMITRNGRTITVKENNK